MRNYSGYGIALITLLLAPVAGAETQAQLLGSGPVTTSAPMPDPAHIPIVFGKDLKWTGSGKGQQSATLFGNPDKPGIYGLLIKWLPGTNSTPHFHTTDRYIYVVSGTWWVSSSAIYDRTKMYPVPAGSFVTDIMNTVHWDGSLASDTEPCIILLVGEGPMTTVRYVQKDPASPEFTPADTTK